MLRKILYYTLASATALTVVAMGMYVVRTIYHYVYVIRLYLTLRRDLRFTTYLGVYHYKPVMKEDEKGRLVPAKDTYGNVKYQLARVAPHRQGYQQE